MSKIDSDLFNTGEQPQAPSNCPECDGALVLKHSKNGPFWGCSQYPSCTYVKATHENQSHTVKLLDLSCPGCTSQLAVKSGRFGLFIGCTAFPACTYVADLAHTDDEGVACPACSAGQLVQRANKYGKSFFACDAYPKCKYVVNTPPVAQTCPECGWKILVEKKGASGKRLICPQKQCDYKSPI
ncbi:DNA topoisomerase family protein [Flocculibacter collagenilyticus]|uniref:DNA topoisomerase family protein n=1 Tax=Flocculibacter collagenilyticus TaxID=2744479 RepID=UPI0018F6853E|nr:topoisomerase DNA-binding C4 zinc finger domain-containing protein [Flocculibacter collagenilyticus]